MKHQPRLQQDRDHWDTWCETPLCEWGAVNLKSEDAARQLVDEHRQLVSQPATPELDKQLEVIHSGKSETVQEFYDWLKDQGYVLAKWGSERQTASGPTQELFPVYVQPEQLMADFFGIDRNKVEQERRAILEACREQRGEAG